jgi:Holliday junction resolvase YEN1
LDGVRNNAADDLPSFLDAWRESLRNELRTNTSGYLLSLHPALAENIPSDFPDINVLSLYMDPVTSEGTHTAPTDISFKQPQLAALATFAERNFVWGTTLGVLTHFAASVFPGLALRELLDAASAADGGQTVNSASCPLLGHIVGVRENQATCYLPEVRVVLTPDQSLSTQICSGIHAAYIKPASVDTWLKVDYQKLRAWLPRAIVEHVVPDLLVAFTAPKVKKRKRSKLIVTHLHLK